LAKTWVGKACGGRKGALVQKETPRGAAKVAHLEKVKSVAAGGGFLVGRVARGTVWGPLRKSSRGVQREKSWFQSTILNKREEETKKRKNESARGTAGRKIRQNRKTGRSKRKKPNNTITLTGGGFNKAA